MLVLSWVVYGVVALVFGSGMYVICLRIRRDRAGIRNLLSMRVTPLALPPVLVVTALPAENNESLDIPVVVVLALPI